MKLTYNICDIGGCKIRITDYTQDTDEYIPEGVIDEDELEAAYANNKFKYSYTYTVNIIQYTSLKESSIIKSFITSHDVFLDEVYYETPKDGFYTIHHFVLPSVEWLHEELEKEESVLTTTDLAIYVTDGSNIYQYVNNELILKDLELIIEINSEGTTLSKETKTMFQICKLYNCYINLCKKLLNLPLEKCAPTDYNSQELIFKRDFVWMTINIIKYHVQYDQLNEAQRILEMINYCNNFCNDILKTKPNNVGCGCSG